ncbi:hypothetical protein HDU99_002586 [Rhizoclosmatium hyalinum]|nr:hypothetical protein HDU99_002586 [Rhizoclosmatium hyalinum]
MLPLITTVLGSEVNTKTGMSNDEFIESIRDLDETCDEHHNGNDSVSDDPTFIDMDDRLNACELLYLLIKKQENVAWLDANHPMTLVAKMASPEFRIRNDIPTYKQQFNSISAIRIYLWKYNATNEATLRWPKTFQAKALLYRVGNPLRTVAELKSPSGDFFWVDFNFDYVHITFIDKEGHEIQFEVNYDKLESFSVDHIGITLFLSVPLNLGSDVKVSPKGPFVVSLSWTAGIVAGGPNDIITIMNINNVPDNSPESSQNVKFSVGTFVTLHSETGPRGESNFNSNRIGGECTVAAGDYTNARYSFDEETLVFDRSMSSSKHESRLLPHGYNHQPVSSSQSKHASQSYQVAENVLDQIDTIPPPKFSVPITEIEFDDGQNMPDLPPPITLANVSLRRPAVVVDKLQEKIPLPPTPKMPNLAKGRHSQVVEPTRAGPITVGQKPKPKTCEHEVDEIVDEPEVTVVQPPKKGKGRLTKKPSVDVVQEDAVIPVKGKRLGRGRKNKIVEDEEEFVEAPVVAKSAAMKTRRNSKAVAVEGKFPVLALDTDAESKLLPTKRVQVDLDIPIAPQKNVNPLGAKKRTSIVAFVEEATTIDEKSSSVAAAKDPGSPSRMDGHFDEFVVDNGPIQAIKSLPSNSKSPSTPVVTVEDAPPLHKLTGTPSRQPNTSLMSSGSLPQTVSKISKLAEPSAGENSVKRKGTKRDLSTMSKEVLDLPNIIETSVRSPAPVPSTKKRAQMMESVKESVVLSSSRTQDTTNLVRPASAVKKSEVPESDRKQSLKKPASKPLVSMASADSWVGDEESSILSHVNTPTRASQSQFIGVSATSFSQRKEKSQGGLEKSALGQTTVASSKNKHQSIAASAGTMKRKDLSSSHREPASEGKRRRVFETPIPKESDEDESGLEDLDSLESVDQRKALKKELASRKRAKVDDNSHFKVSRLTRSHARSRSDSIIKGDVGEVEDVNAKNQRTSAKPAQTVSYASFSQEITTTSPDSNNQYVVKRQMEVKMTHSRSPKKGVPTRTHASRIKLPTLVSESSSLSDSTPKSETDIIFLESFIAIVGKKLSANTRATTEKWVDRAVSNVKFPEFDAKMNVKCDLFSYVRDECDWRFSGESLGSFGQVRNGNLTTFLG